MKTFAPKCLHGAQLRQMLADLPATPKEVSKILQVTERTVWRWLADDSCPWHVLALLWHMTADGIQCVAIDHGNGAMYERGYVRSMEATTARLQLQIHKLEIDLMAATLAAGPSVPANCPVFRVG